MWPKPGSDKPAPKLTFVTGFAPWNWIIGTGVYVDDLTVVVGTLRGTVRFIAVGAPKLADARLKQLLERIPG